MKVTRTGNKTQRMGSGLRVNVQKAGEFSLAFDLANKNQSENELSQMFKDISKLGEKLVSTKSLEDVKKYKNKIKEYLTYVVKNTYSLKTDMAPFSYGIHVRIEVINEKLDKLTKDLIEDQRGTLELAERIEEIKGLLVDAFK